MDEDVGMQNDKGDWRQDKKADDRQRGVAQQRQFDRAAQEQILMGNGGDGDDEVRRRAEIAQPQAEENRGRVLDASARRVDVARGLRRRGAGGNGAGGFQRRNVLL